MFRRKGVSSEGASDGRKRLQPVGAGKDQAKGAEAKQCASDSKRGAAQATSEFKEHTSLVPSQKTSPAPAQTTATAKTAPPLRERTLGKSASASRKGVEGVQTNGDGAGEALCRSQSEPLANASGHVELRPRSVSAPEREEAPEAGDSLDGVGLKAVSEEEDEDSDNSNSSQEAGGAAGARSGDCDSTTADPPANPRASFRASLANAVSAVVPGRSWFLRRESAAPPMLARRVSLALRDDVIEEGDKPAEALPQKKGRRVSVMLQDAVCKPLATVCECEAIEDIDECIDEAGEGSDSDTDECTDSGDEESAAGPFLPLAEFKEVWSEVHQTFIKIPRTLRNTSVTSASRSRMGSVYSESEAQAFKGSRESVDSCFSGKGSVSGRSREVEDVSRDEKLAFLASTLRHHPTNAGLAHTQADLKKRPTVKPPGEIDTMQNGINTEFSGHSLQLPSPRTLASSANFPSEAPSKSGSLAPTKSSSACSDLAWVMAAQTKAHKKQAVRPKAAAADACGPAPPPPAPAAASRESKQLNGAIILPVAPSSDGSVVVSGGAALVRPTPAPLRRMGSAEKVMGYFAGRGRKAATEEESNHKTPADRGRVSRRSRKSRKISNDGSCGDNKSDPTASTETAHIDNVPCEEGVAKSSGLPPSPKARRNGLSASHLLRRLSGELRTMFK